MAKKTPQELDEIRKQKADERRLREEHEIAERLKREREREEMISREEELKKSHEELWSYLAGIYDEATKLSNKRSTDPMSDRMVSRANRAIESALELLADEDDPYAKEIELFVPAGDDIEARDVVLTLRQVRDALERMKNRHSNFWNPRLY